MSSAKKVGCAALLAALAIAAHARAETLRVTLLADPAASSISGGTWGSVVAGSGSDVSSLTLAPSASGSISLDVFVSLSDGATGNLGLSGIAGGFYNVAGLGATGGIFTGSFTALGAGFNSTIYDPFTGATNDGVTRTNGNVYGTSSISAVSGWWAGVAAFKTIGGTNYGAYDAVGSGPGFKFGTITFTVGVATGNFGTPGDFSQLYYFPQNNLGTAPLASQLQGFTNSGAVADANVYGRSISWYLQCTRTATATVNSWSGTAVASGTPRILAATGLDGAPDAAYLTFTNIPFQIDAGIPLFTSAWTGYEAGTSWSTSGNWNPGVPGGTTPAPYDTAGFPAGVARVAVTLDGATPVLSGIAINYGLGSPAAYSIAQGSGSGCLTLGGSNAAISVNGGTSNTISAPLVLASSASINAVAGTTLTLAGAISGSGGLTVSGPGVLTLSGSNTYSGDTTVNDGVLKNASASGLPANGPLAISGGALDLGGFSLTTSAAVSFQGGVTQNGSIVHNGSAYDGQAGTVSASLQGTAGLNKTSDGYLGLSASNNYTGTTTVSGGVLRLSHSAALPGGTGSTSSGSNLTLDGGVVELAAGDFTRSAGTGAGQVQFTANGGGFSALSANRVVNLGGSSATLAWGSGCFLPNGAPLMLGTESADSLVDFQNPLDLGSGTQTVLVASGFGTVRAKLSGVLSGSGALALPGNGTLEFTASNCYTGSTTVSGGILRLSNFAALPTSSNLVFDGGVVELNAGDFTRNLGTGAGQVQFTANGGGFSAVGANRVVNFSSSAALTWGSTSGFLPDGTPLILGTWSADSMVDFQNPINLGSGTQTVYVVAGSGTTGVDARLSGTLSGSGGLMLPPYANGTLELTASNGYTGATTVSGGILRLSNSAALPTSSNLILDGGVVELNAGDFTRNLGAGAGQVQFTANGGGFSAVGTNRAVNLSSSAALTWGGTSGFLPNGAPLILSSWSGNSTIDFQNPINLGSSTQTIQVVSNSGTAAVDARLSGTLSGIGGLAKTGNGTLELTASNNYTGATIISGGILRLSNSSALPGGTGATSTGSNLTLDGGVVELSAGDFTRNVGTGAGQVRFTANGGGFSAVGANRVVNLSNSATLVWDTGGFLPNGAWLRFGSWAADSVVDFQNPMILGSGQQTVWVTSGSGGATVAAELSGVLSGSGGLSIAGDGALVLSCTENTYSGGTVVDGGTLILASGGALPDGSSLTIGAGGTLIFDPSAVASPAVPLDGEQHSAAVPEPGTFALFVAGLALSIAVFLRRGIAIVVASAAFAARKFCDGYFVVRLTIALLLLSASGLKAHQLMTQPTLGIGVLESRPFLIAVVEFELVFALWLLSSLLAPPLGREKVGERLLTWHAVLACFSIFAGYSLYKALSGKASCGCFGRVEVNPWYTFVLDVVVVASLLRWRPCEAILLRSPFQDRDRPEAIPAARGLFSRPIAHLALVLGIWLLLGVPAAIAMSNASYAFADLGEVTDGGNAVILQPDKWVGKRLPLLPLIDIGDRLSRGDWLVVLHRDGCPKCREALPSYARLAREWSCRPDSPRVAFVEIPGNNEQFVGTKSPLVAVGRLGGATLWYVETPVVVTLNSGRVARVL